MICAEPGCPVWVVKGRCEKHERTWRPWMVDPVTQRAQEARRRATQPAWRLWYKLARWDAMRLVVLTEEPMCRACQAEGYVTASAEVDHIAPHRGDPALFWDRANLQGLCASCHAKKTARGE